MTRLMYSPDDQVVSRQALEWVETPRAQGPRHRPVPFFEYVNDVARILNDKRIDIVNEEYVLTKNRNSFFGMMEIESRDIPEHLDFRVNVGLRGSHDMKVARGILLGTQVIVCSNLCFSGNLGTFQTKQTLNIYQRIYDMIHEATDRVIPLVQEKVSLYNGMKDARLSERFGDAKLVDIYRAGGLSGDQLGKAINEWREPSFDHGEYSVWRLFNASTQALKPAGEHVNMVTVADRSRIVADKCEALVA